MLISSNNRGEQIEKGSDRLLGDFCLATTCPSHICPGDICPGDQVPALIKLALDLYMSISVCLDCVFPDVNIYLFVWTVYFWSFFQDVRLFDILASDTGTLSAHNLNEYLFNTRITAVAMYQHYVFILRICLIDSCTGGFHPVYRDLVLIGIDIYSERTYFIVLL